MEEMVLFKGPRTNRPKNSTNKVSIIGSGEIVGICAASLCRNRYANEICLIDPIHPGRANAEMLDLKNCNAYFPDIMFTSSSEISYSKCSDVILLCLENETLNTFIASNNIPIIQKNIDIFRKFVPEIVKYSPQTVLLVATFPYNVMTHAAWIFSKFPKHRVLGLGCVLESSKFRLVLAQRFDVSPNVCNAWIVGALGKLYKFPVWSDASIAGTKLLDALPSPDLYLDADDWYIIPRDLSVRDKNIIVKLRRATATACSVLIRAILSDSHEVFSVSTNAKGTHGIRKNVHIGLPCVIGRHGVYAIVNQLFSTIENSNFIRATHLTRDLYRYLNFSLEENLKLSKKL